jgi:hypothetical protein
MRIPVIRGLIERRILVNYRADPAVVARTLPPPFRPGLVRGSAVAGICLIRLAGVRPRFLPAWVGLSSENAAHRTAVVWDAFGQEREGVYVRRRDTSSFWNALVGGRLFPGAHHRARFSVRETAERFEVALESRDGATRVSVVANLATRLPESSVFRSLEEASAFFRAGSLGYSATRDPKTFQGLELRCLNWGVEPLAVESVHSSYFEDESVFPKGSVTFDSALLMRGIQHEWLGQADLCCGVPAGAAAAQPAPVPSLSQAGARCEKAGP